MWLRYGFCRAKPTVLQGRAFPPFPPSLQDRESFYDRLPRSPKQGQWRKRALATQLSGGQAVLRIGKEKCPYCYRSDVYVSNPKSVWEELAVLLLLRTVRCHDCMHRFYRPLFVPTPVVPTRSSALKKPTQQTDTSKSDKQRLV